MTFASKHMVEGLAGLLLMAGLPAGAQTGPVSAAAPLAAQSAPVKGAGRFVVVLDAAHGGEDGGGQLGGGVAEKTVTLALSVRLRSLLTARGFQVVTTREGNVNLDSVARAQAVNHAVAGAASAACLSLHASETGSGLHIFVSSLTATAPGRFLAWKTAQSAFIGRSLKLAGTVNSAFERGATGNAGGDAPPVAIPATLAKASLPLLDSMTCPAVALEFAPIRGADGKVVTEVTDPEYQTQIVDVLASAMLAWRTDGEQDSGRPDLKAAGARLP